MIALVTQVFLPVSLAFIMLTMGLSLVPADFSRVFRKPRAILTGLFAQVLMVPAIAAVLAATSGAQVEIAVGLILVAACPGGVTSNLLTHLARGDTALSISMTAIVSVVAAITLPLVVNLALYMFAGSGSSFDIPIGNMMAGVFLITTVPVILGMAIRHRWPDLTARLALPARRLVIGLFALIVIGTFAGHWPYFERHLIDVGPLVVALNVAAMLTGAYLPVLFGVSGGASRIAISMECGMQNAAVGIFVALTVLAQPALVVPSIIYAFTMNISAIVLILARTRAVGFTREGSQG